MHDMQVCAGRLRQQAGLADGSVGAGGKISRGNNLHAVTLRQPALDVQASIVPRQACSRTPPGASSGAERDPIQ
jgi:hypothetical protein